MTLGSAAAPQVHGPVNLQRASPRCGTKLGWCGLGRYGAVMAKGTNMSRSPSVIGTATGLKWMKLDDSVPWSSGVATRRGAARVGVEPRIDSH